MVGLGEQRTNVMTKAQPETEYSAIIEELNGYFYGEPLGEIDKMKLKKKIESVKNINPFEGYNLLGILACIDSDIQGINNCFTNAIRLSGGHHSSHCYYGTSLFILGLYEEAFIHMKTAFEKDPLNLEYLEHLYVTSLITGDIEMAKKYSEKWDKMTVSTKTKKLDEVFFFSNPLPRLLSLKSLLNQG